MSVERSTRIEKPNPARAFYDYVDRVRIQRGTSMRVMCGEAGVSPSSMSALNTGQSERPSMDTCFKFAESLKVDPAQLLSISGYQAEPVASLAEVDPRDPELSQLINQLKTLSEEEKEPVKEFIRFELNKAADRRAPRRGRRI